MKRKSQCIIYQAVLYRSSPYNICVTVSDSTYMILKYCDSINTLYFLAELYTWSRLFLTILNRLWAQESLGFQVTGELRSNYEWRSVLDRRDSKMVTANSIRPTFVELLTKDNFDTWKMQVEALLMKNDALKYVSGERVKPEVHVGGSSRCLSDQW